MNLAEEMEGFNVRELSLILQILTQELSRRTEDVQDLLQGVFQVDTNLRDELQRTLIHQRGYHPKNTYFFREVFSHPQSIKKLTLNALNSFNEAVTKEIGKRLESYQLLKDHLYGSDLTQKKEKGEWVSPYGEEFDQEMEDWQNNPQYKYNTLREC